MKPRSQFAGFLLVLLFGPFGALYGGAGYGMFAIILSLGFMAITPVLVLIGWITSFALVAIGIRNHNKQVELLLVRLQGES